jgi:hypothetical protein
VVNIDPAHIDARVILDSQELASRVLTLVRQAMTQEIRTMVRGGIGRSV